MTYEELEEYLKGRNREQTGCYYVEYWEKRL